MPVDPRRVTLLIHAPLRKGPVVYWMSRDQRWKDNWALIYSQEQALRMRVPLVVVFCLVADYLHAPLRHYAFMLRGLSELSAALHRKNIAFTLLCGSPPDVLAKFISSTGAGMLVTDFDPLRTKQEWKTAVARKVAVPFHEVDAHNIVPCRFASPKQEYGAYTIRPKILRRLKEFLVPFPALRRHPHGSPGPAGPRGFADVMARLRIDRSVGEVPGIVPGEKAAHTKLKGFLQRGLDRYAADRNDPSLSGQSGLSPYLHFGQISAQRIALSVIDRGSAKLNTDAFLEELIVRRELSDNFCHYNPQYDAVAGFPAWAQETLRLHRRDRRRYLYSQRQFEQAETHDDLWNAAQLQMAVTGKMHGYLRMYWAKKILEWSRSPEEAIAAAVYLNDRYSLDGRDPNGYAGIAWSIGGVHDRAWGEREVFGKVRYMSYNGARSKFDVHSYIRKINALAGKK